MSPNTQGRGKSQKIKLKNVLLQLFKSDKQTFEETLGSGKFVLTFLL